MMENEKFFFLSLLEIEGKLFVFMNSSFSYIILELNIVREK